jgi:hypothetical protein
MFLNHLYGGMDEPELKIIDVFVCKLRKSSPTPPKAATSSKPSGAAATCCASRTRKKCALSKESFVRLSPPDWTPPRMAGFFRLGGAARRPGFQCLVIPGCALSRADPESSNVRQLLDSGLAPRGAPRNDGIMRPPAVAFPSSVRMIDGQACAETTHRLFRIWVLPVTHGDVACAGRETSSFAKKSGG